MNRQRVIPTQTYICKEKTISDDETQLEKNLVVFIDELLVN